VSRRQCSSAKRDIALAGLAGCAERCSSGGEEGGPRRGASTHWLLELGDGDVCLKAGENPVKGYAVTHEPCVAGEADTSNSVRRMVKSRSVTCAGNGTSPE